MVAQIWEAPETLKREETFDPKTSISNLDFDDLTADYVSLAFGDNLLELFDQTVEPDTNYFIYPSEVNGEPFQVAEDAEYGLETLDMYLRYTDYNGRVCEDRAEQQITIVPPESLFMTVELDPGTFDLGSLTGASDTVQTLKMRARLGPDENDQYVSGKDVSFTIPCSLAYESCSGDYVVPSTGITLSDGYTGWVEAKVRTTANRVGNWTITANYEGDNLNYGPSEADATFRITGNIAEGALPVIECSETDHKSDCDEAMECIFNSGQQCLAELADLVPYLDKPTAVALAANDICEMASRTEGGDPVGAVVTGVLFTVDVGDNLADAVPVIGNAAGIVVDLIEGAIDCVEGIIYDQFKKCGGYTGCFVKVVDELAERGSQGIDWFEAHVLGFGSPVDVTILDADGSVLGIDDGVFVLDQEDAKFAVILNPEEIGDYQVRLRGTAHGTYSYQSAVIQEDQVVAQAEEADIEIALNEVVVYEDDEIMASGRAAWYWYALGGLISLVVLLGLTKVAFRSKKISR